MNNLAMFDYDGVIADSYDVFTSAFMRACRRTGFDRITSNAQLMELFDGNLFKGLRDTGLSAQAVDQLLKIFETEISGELHAVKLFNGRIDRTIMLIYRYTTHIKGAANGTQ